MSDVKKTLPVIGVYKENFRSFYSVKYKNEEYQVRMLEYQKGRPMPETLNCMVKSNGDQIDITQDLEYAIKELYKEGKEYSCFKVRDKQGSYYDVVDPNGLRFRLTEYGDCQLSMGQYITAKVLSIRQVRVCLKLINDANQRTKLPYYTIDQLESLMGQSKGYLSVLAHMLNESPNLEQAKELYQSKDGLWILEAISEIDYALLRRESLTEDNKGLVEIFGPLCIYVIEGSDILNHIDPDDRRQKINEFTSIAEHAEDFGEAYKLFERGEAQSYVEQQLTNLKKSENLYRPESKLRIMMSLFNLDEKVRTEMMDQIFDIIINGKNKANWKAEPFRSAFVNLLEIFISEYRIKSVRTTGIDLIHKEIIAIAIQQLLSNENDQIDRRLNRATFYRLLAYIQRHYSQDMLDDAFNCLFTKYDSRVEYEWEDLDALAVLYTKVGNSPYRSQNMLESFQRMKYKRDHLELIVDRKHIELRHDLGSKEVSPGNLLPWKDMTISTINQVSNKVKNCDNAHEVSKFWKDVSEELWNTQTIQPQKYEPFVGDRVILKITGESDDYQYLFCEIVSDKYQGKGWLNIVDASMYLSGGRGSNINLFLDDDGAPFLVEGTVIEEPDKYDEMEFSLLDVIDEYVDVTYDADDEFDCLILSFFSDKDTDTNYAIGVSSNGVSCRVIPQEGVVLSTSDVIRVKYSSYKINGQLECTYVRRSDVKFSVADAFRNLMKNLSLEESMEEDIVEDPMDEKVMREIIGILDRQSAIYESRGQSYSCLAVASILGHLIGDKKVYSYYEKRKEIILATEEYERNGYVDDERLEKLLSSLGDDLVNSDYLINEAVTKFTILQSLKHKENVKTLFEISEKSSNPSIVKSAHLAIAILLTDRFEIPNVSKQLQDKLNEQMGIKVMKSTLKDYGIESQTIEFKTSVVFPPDNNMQPQPLVQGDNILRVVCGFLNSDNGGTLYIGVNNYGAACGVDSDLKYLKKDKDGYGRYIHNMINRELGNIANQCCTDCDWEEDQGYEVYAMHIKPSPELIDYKGKYWIRQDTETRVLKEDKFKTYQEMHKKAYLKFEAEHISPSIEIDSNKNSTSQTIAQQPKSTVITEEILTSNHRENIIYDWEDGYGVDTVAYLHLLPKSKYIVSDDGTYAGTELSLQIKESEKNGYLAVAYRSGNILLVRMSDILNKQGQGVQNRCVNDVPLFVCPMEENQSLLTVWRNTVSDLCARIDTVADLLKKHCDGTLQDEGALIHETKFKALESCEVIPQTILDKMAKYVNAGNGVGQKITFNDRNQFAKLLNLKISAE